MIWLLPFTGYAKTTGDICVHNVGTNLVRACQIVSGGAPNCHVLAVGRIVHFASKTGETINLYIYNAGTATYQYKKTITLQPHETAEVRWKDLKNHQTYTNIPNNCF